jgi:hypothetical protein
VHTVDGGLLGRPFVVSVKSFRGDRPGTERGFLRR